MVLGAGLLAAGCGAPSEPTSGEPPACGEDTWASYGQQALATQCAVCHAHEADFVAQAEVQRRAQEISWPVADGMMPPQTVAKLTEYQRARLVKYLQCGAP